MSEKNTQAKKEDTQKKRKPRRRIRWSLLILPAVLIIAVIAVLRVPRAMEESRLRNLGYTQEEVDRIEEMELAGTILENEYYSPHLADAIRRGTLQKDYIPLYIATEPSREFNSRDFLLYRRLEDLGYEEDQLANLFASLKFSELTPLLVLDYQWNEQFYIDDVIENRELNAAGTFLLDMSYRTDYRLKAPAEDPASVSALVNKTYYLPADYSPDDLKTVTEEYSVSGMRLRKEAADAAVKMCVEALNEGYAFFVSGSYMDYVSIQELYEKYTDKFGESFADLEIGKAGFCEFQTGLSMNLAATYEEYEDFRETECYRWLKENSAKYGFIERYPEGKEELTGCAADASYFRYLGKDLAASVKASGLTYDEYYCLILNGWYDESFRASDFLIQSAAEELASR